MRTDDSRQRRQFTRAKAFIRRLIPLPLRYPIRKFSFVLRILSAFHFALSLSSGNKLVFYAARILNLNLRTLTLENKAKYSRTYCEGRALMS